MAARLRPIYSAMKSIKRLSFLGLSRLTTSAARNIYDYMSVTYSISGLLVILGLSGRYELASDVAVAQGSVMATFYVMSGDARHLILSERMKSSHILFIRLLILLPLSVTAYFLCQVGGHMEFVIAGSVIARRGAEWLSEVHLTEIERQGQHWQGLPLQVLLFSLLVIQIIYFDDFWLLWVWAFSPIFFSLKFLMGPEPCRFYGYLPHLASTASIGLSIYMTRILIVEFAGKTTAGILFPAIMIGSFAGTLFANIIGPTLSRNNTIDSKYLSRILIAWILFGLTLLIFAETFFQKSLGFSLIGGAVMVFAHKSRLSILKARHTLGPDALVHLIVVASIPAIYYLIGSEWLSSLYLWNAILALVFYRGAENRWKFSEK